MTRCEFITKNFIIFLLLKNLNIFKIKLTIFGNIDIISKLLRRVAKKLIFGQKIF